MSSGAAASIAQRAEFVDRMPTKRSASAHGSAAAGISARLIGRERETEAVVTLLSHGDARLVVLTGPGGVGKTRLALHVADVLDQAFRDGVWFIPLASIWDHELVIPTIARALGLWDRSQLSLHARLEAMLANTRTLLVLDNVEQVVDSAPQMIELLAACPELRILVTSRTVLHVSGEHDVAVSPLHVETPESEPAPRPDAVPDAVRLFAERTRAVRSDFALTDQNTGEIAAICRRLDGLPLAIELAAARIATLTPSTLLERLDRRLQTLTTDAPDAPERLRTMRNTIAWSYDLLSPAHQTVFRRISVFVGGFSIPAMRAVAQPDAGDDEWQAIDLLAGLMDHSLITQAEGPERESRFSMLETIREYGLERLAEGGEEADVRARHARWCIDLARHIAAEYEYRKDSGWRDRLEAEHANFRAALRWLLDHGDVTAFLELAVALHPLWYHVGHTREGVEWLQAGIARAASAPAPIVLKAMLAASEMMGEQCLHDAANDLAARAATLAREAGESQSLAEALFILGKNAQLSGEDGEAEGRVHIAEALELFDAIGETTRAVHVRTYLAMLGPGGGSHHLSDPAELKTAQGCWKTELAMFREQGNMIGITQAIHGLAYSVYLGNDYARALALSHDALRLRWSMGDIRFIPAHFEDIGDIARTSGQIERAARLYSAADALRERLDTPIPWWFQEEYQREIDACRRAMPSTQFNRAWSAGRDMPLKGAVDEALSLKLPEPGEAAAEAAQLTRRERQVLRLMVDGRTNAEIAEELSISWRTVARHVSSILSRLDVDSRTAAVSHAIRSNLLLAPEGPARRRSRRTPTSSKPT